MKACHLGHRIRRMRVTIAERSHFNPPHSRRRSKVDLILLTIVIMDWGWVRESQLLIPDSISSSNSHFETSVTQARDFQIECFHLLFVGNQWGFTCVYQENVGSALSR